MQDIEKSLLNRVRGSGKGWCFTPTDFADLGGTAAVWTALHRLAQRRIIRRLAQGLYDFPRTHAELGMLSPDPEAVAQALARSRGIRIQPSGAYAANLLGLSEQVPARIVFLTDGAPRRIRQPGDRAAANDPAQYGDGRSDQRHGHSSAALYRQGSDHVRASPVAPATAERCRETTTDQGSPLCSRMDAATPGRNQR